MVIPIPHMDISHRLRIPHPEETPMPRHNKPAGLRALHGSKVRPRHRDRVDAAPVASLEPPPGLSREELDVWAFYAPALARLKVLTTLDREALAQVCIGTCQIREIRRQQQAPGYERLVKNRSNALDAQLRNWLQVTRLAAAD